MKNLILSVTFVPAAALAHGGHAPLPDGPLAVSHTSLVLSLVIIACAAALAFRQWWRS